MVHKMKTLVSIGHHESAQGAKFETEEGVVTEFLLARAWVHHICNIMGDQCIEVPEGKLKDKVKFINETVKDNKNVLAVEIHFNSAKKWIDANNNGIIDDGEMVNIGRGSESLYYPGKWDSINKQSVGYSKRGKLAATMMQDALGAVMKPNRGPKPGWYQMNPEKGADYFLKHTNCVSIIIEPDFIDNSKELTENFNTACYIIANTILEIQREFLNG